MKVAGIDPGKHGAIVIVDGNNVVAQWLMPTIGTEIDHHALDSIFHDLAAYECPVVLERVHSMPGQGVSSTFKFGMGYGCLLQLLASHKITHSLVLPSRWTKEMHTNIDSKIEPKKRSLIAVQREFPNHSFLATPRSKVPHSGLVDAALLALYGFRVIYK